MSKYDPLWKWINKNKTDDFSQTVDFERIKEET